MRRTVGYVSLVVRDYDEAIAYYTNVLGFRLVEDTPLSDTKRWVLIAPPGSTETCLLLAKASSAEQRERIGDQTGGRVFLFLHTDDFHRDHREFLSRGVQFLEAPRVEKYGTVAVFADLYGNRWDLLQLNSRGPRLIDGLQVRELVTGDIDAASLLACAVFHYAVAPSYSADGVRTFCDYAAPDAWRLRHDAGNKAWGAFDGPEMVGVVHVRDETHISLLFVRPEYQRRGIARRLVDQVQRERPGGDLTVHSSPNAVAAYARLGFQATGPEQLQSGIRFVSMRRPANPKGGE